MQCMRVSYRLLLALSTLVDRSARRRRGESVAKHTCSLLPDCVEAKASASALTRATRACYVANRQRARRPRRRCGECLWLRPERGCGPAAGCGARHGRDGASGPAGAEEGRRRRVASRLRSGAQLTRSACACSAHPPDEEPRAEALQGRAEGVRGVCARPGRVAGAPRVWPSRAAACSLSRRRQVWACRESANAMSACLTCVPRLRAPTPALLAAACCVSRASAAVCLPFPAAATRTPRRWMRSSCAGSRRASRT